MDIEILEDCPFCGGRAYYGWNESQQASTMAVCSQCGATAFWRKWNWRAAAMPSHAEQAAELAELRAAKWQVQHADTANTLVQQGMALESQAAELTSLRAVADKMAEALTPFTAFADKSQRSPPEMAITSGSTMAKRQLCMGDCYEAAEVRAEYAALSPPTDRAGGCAIATTGMREDK